MKKLILFVMLITMPIAAMAQDTPYTANSEIQTEQNWQYYISANIGAIASDVKIKDDSFFDFGGVTNFEIGAQYNRYRLALAYQDRAEVSELIQILAGHTVSLENKALRVNGYYDYVSSKSFAMYVGLGLGIDRYDYTIEERYSGRKESKHGPAFTGGVSTGMIFSFWHLGIDLGFAVDYVSYPRMYSFGPTIGLRYNF